MGLIDFQKIQNGELPFCLALAMGKVQYADSIVKFGRNTAIGGSYEDIWFAGGTEQLLTAAETLDIVSDDLDDTAAGSGVRAVRIKGLDANYNLIQEDVTMDGTTPVTTTNSFLRVFRAFGTLFGSSETNEGTVTITATTAGTTHASLEPGVGQTQKTQFTVPNGYYGYFYQLYYSGLRNDQFTIDVQTKALNDGWRTRIVANGYEELGSFSLNVPGVVEPKTDIKVRAINTGTGSVDISAFYEMVFIKEEFVNASHSRF